MRYVYPGLIDFSLEWKPAKNGYDEDIEEVRFEVFDQDSSITKVLTGPAFYFEASNKCEIQSIDCVAITDDSVYLKGQSKKGKYPDWAVYSTDLDEAEHLVARLLQAFSELAASRGITLQGHRKPEEQLSFWE